MNISKNRRYIRLLPGVVLACGALLVLNASPLVREALAQESAHAAADATTAAPQSVNKDYAGGDGQIASAEEVNVLTSLAKRDAAIDAREAEIQSQANVLAATEERVDSKIAQLKDLQDKVTALIGQRDAAQQKQIDALVRTYSAMGKKAGPIFAGLPDDVAIPVAQGISPDILSQILQGMSPDAAQKLTVKLANKLTLPDTNGAAAAPVPAPAASTAAAPALAAAPAAAAKPPG